MTTSVCAAHAHDVIYSARRLGTASTKHFNWSMENPLVYDQQRWHPTYRRGHGGVVQRGVPAQHAVPAVLVAPHEGVHLVLVHADGVVPAAGLVGVSGAREVAGCRPLPRGVVRRATAEALPDGGEDWERLGRVGLGLGWCATTHGWRRCEE